MNYWGRPRSARIGGASNDYDGFGYDSDVRDIGVVKEATIPFLNLDELRKEERSSDKNAKQIYKLILAKCHQKIRRTNKTTDYRMCYYEIPHFIPGYPVFDVEAACNFVYHQLLGNGLYVEPVGPSRLYISWKEQDINRDVYDYRSQKMVNKPNLYKVGVSPVDERDEDRKQSGIPRIIGTNKKGAIQEDERVSMLQYDSSIPDMVPVNAKKVNKYRDDSSRYDDGRRSLSLDDVSINDTSNKYGSNDTSNKYGGYGSGNSWGGEGSFSSVLGEVNYQSMQQKKKRRRRKKSREEPRMDNTNNRGDGYNINAHREMYKQNMMDLDEQYIPSPY